MTEVFRQMVVDAGIPTTDAQIKAEWQATATANNSPFNNDSDYSPLWRLITALVSAPVLWLVELIITSVLPNYFVKFASGIYLDFLANDREVYRKTAAKATGRLLFTRAQTAGVLAVPIGTEVQSASINGKVYAVKTTAAGSFADGVGSIYINVEALAVGQAYNLAAGYYAILVTTVAGVTAVTNEVDWLTAPGADLETDDELRDRARNQFNTVNQYHTDAVYLSLITSYAGLKTNNVWFEHGAPRGPGTANAHILLDVGTPSGTFLTDVQSYVMDNGNHGHGDDLQVLAIPEILVVITYDYWEVANLDGTQSAALAAGVENFIRAAFRENADYSPTVTQPWSKFSFSEMAGELHDNFPDLLSIDFVNTDIDTTLNVARISTLTGTLQP